MQDRLAEATEAGEHDQVAVRGLGEARDEVLLDEVDGRGLEAVEGRQPVVEGLGRDRVQEREVGHVRDHATAQPWTALQDAGGRVEVAEVVAGQQHDPPRVRDADAVEHPITGDVADHDLSPVDVLELAQPRLAGVALDHG